MSRNECGFFWMKFHEAMNSSKCNFVFYEFPNDSGSYFSGKVNDETPSPMGRPFIGVDLVNGRGL